MHTVENVDKFKTISFNRIMKIKKGDQLLFINGEEVKDTIDYSFFLAQENLDVVLLRRGREVTVHNVSGHELMYASFEDDLSVKCCKNNCIFCFVSQLPKGMRKTLYFKDDDWRHSLLFGNYVTLTNLTDEERIYDRCAHPLYISVHTVDETLRKQMLGNPSAPDIKPILNRFYEKGITFHAQVVLCPGFNDGEVLQETMEYLHSLHPVCRSLAVVPVGLTQFRGNLTQICEIDMNVATDTLGAIENFAKRVYSKDGTSFVFASDELYIKAGQKLPSYEYYEDFCQIENGVGLIAQTLREADYALSRCALAPHRTVSFATSVDFAPFLQQYLQNVHEKLSMDFRVYPIENEFFGKSITVAGLLTAKDVIQKLKGQPLGDILLLPPAMFAANGFTLDDLTVSDIEQQLEIQINTDGIEYYLLKE